MNGPRMFLGLDPGVSGGLAVVDERGAAIAAVKMPETERDLFDVLDGFRTASLNEAGFAQIFAVLEKVQPGGLTRGKAGRMGAASAFTFGRGYGALRMALVAAGIPFDEVPPQTWQKALGCLTGGNKNVSKRRAQELFPGVKCTHAISDSLLLAEFCRRSRVAKAA